MDDGDGEKNYLDTFLRVLSVLTSISLVGGFVLVFKQIEQAENRAKLDSRLNMDSIVYTAMLGDDFAETYGRVLTNSPDITVGDRASYSDFLEFLLVNMIIPEMIESGADRPDPLRVCVNFSNPTAAAWMNSVSVYFEEAGSAMHADVVRSIQSVANDCPSMPLREYLLGTSNTESPPDS